MDDKRLDRIEDKLDKITEKLTDHTAIHARNTASLEEHIRRTELLEDAIKPLKQTDSAIRFIIKAVAYSGTLLTIIYTVLKIVKGI